MTHAAIHECTIEGCSIGDCPTCELRAAWAVYAENARTTDGHTTTCPMHRSAWDSCTCGFLNVERAIRRVNRWSVEERAS